MNDIMWNRITVTDFCFMVPLSEDEKIVLQDWVNGKSIVSTSMLHNMSTRKIDKIRNQLRDKYDAVQKYTPLLPPREITK